MAKTTDPNWGGARSGAGRPRGSARSATLSVEALRGVGLDLAYTDRGWWAFDDGPFETLDQAALAAIRFVASHRNDLMEESDFWLAAYKNACQHLPKAQADQAFKDAENRKRDD